MTLILAQILKEKVLNFVTLLFMLFHCGSFWVIKAGLDAESYTDTQDRKTFINSVFYGWIFYTTAMPIKPKVDLFMTLPLTLVLNSFAVKTYF